jgi:hypothetical protein
VSTAVDISVDELYDLFGQEDARKGEPCETAKDASGNPCSREAVFVIRWRADGRPDPADRCACARLTHQCLAHGESYMGLERKQLMVQCHVCQGFMVPIHIDRIRRMS